MTKKEEWLAGTRSAVPIMLGYVPVGIAYGVMARQAGLNTWQTVLMSLTVYGGASEMMAAGMVAQGAAVLTIVLTTFILNLRHIIMSTCVFNQMQGGRLPVRMLAAFGVTDETFAVYTTTANAPRTPRYFFSMALCSYLSWALGSWLGAIATGLLPPLISVHGLGEAAAQDTVEKRKGKEFISIEEFAMCCNKLSKTHIEQLKALGAFAGMAETSQITLF